LFGTTNQVLGGLTLLTVTLYLMQRKGPYLATLVPAVFVFGMTLAAMAWNLGEFYRSPNYTLLAIGGVLLALALWLAVEAILRIWQVRAGPHAR
jgi:carbon starvation protein